MWLILFIYKCYIAEVERLRQMNCGLVERLKHQSRQSRGTTRSIDELSKKGVQKRAWSLGRESTVGRARKEVSRDRLEYFQREVRRAVGFTTPSKCSPTTAKLSPLSTLNLAPMTHSARRKMQKRMADKGINILAARNKVHKLLMRHKN